MGILLEVANKVTSFKNRSGSTNREKQIKYDEVYVANCPRCGCPLFWCEECCPDCLTPNPRFKGEV